MSSRTIPEPTNACFRREALDGYGVLAEIARGGTSTVYLGEHRPTGQRVAIKALDSFYVGSADMVNRLLGEYEVAKRVHHPGLVEIQSADQTMHGIPYVIMELLDGESLAVLTDRRGPPIDTLVAIMVQVASAVAALHAAGVVHCDLKPDNIFVLYAPAPDGWPLVKVIDYGVARLIDERGLTPDRSVVGTPAFMAPEQWHGEPTPKSDVYALGCVLYELVTGSPLFSGSMPELMTAHCERLPERPSLRCHGPDGLNADLERLIVRALAKDPVLRPTMAELESSLAAVLTTLELRARMSAWSPAVARTVSAAHGRRRDSFEARRLDAVG